MNNSNLIIKNEDHNKKLYECCQLGSQDELKNLIRENTIDINSTDKDGFTALHYAAANNHMQCSEVSLSLDSRQIIFYLCCTLIGTCNLYI